MDLFQNSTYILQNGLSRSDFYNGVALALYIVIPICILQMLIRYIMRRLHMSQTYWAVEKSMLAQLRKKTGYTFTNCKKALEIHNNDVGKAELWLKEQAQQMGWAKATKLEGRQTTQGLIAVAVNNNAGALVELNCETDFVSRNETFQTMAEKAAKAVLQYTENNTMTNGILTKIWLDVDQLKQLNAEDGKSLGDHLALMIGSLGENASLKRALSLKSNTGVYVSGYAHPFGLQRDNVMLGRFGGLVAYTPIETKEDVDVEMIGKNICKHVVGMDPKKIGTSDDVPSKDADEETCLIYQEYLLDDSVTVKDILIENGIDVIDFKRFECGQTDILSEKQPLDSIETCQ